MHLYPLSLSYIENKISSDYTQACCHEYTCFYQLLLIDTHSAAASVATRASRTFVDLDLAAGTGVSGQTGASVAALAGVGAGGSIETGLMVCTVVQIWKHQQGITFRNNKYETERVD